MSVKYFARYGHVHLKSLDKASRFTVVSKLDRGYLSAAEGGLPGGRSY